MDFFLFDGKIWRGNGQFCDALIVRNGRIAAIGRREDLRDLAEDCSFIDCGGRLVIPGLFDPYADPEWEGPIPRKGMKAWLREHLQQTARAGITCVQWPDQAGTLSKKLLPVLLQLRREQPLPRVQLLPARDTGLREDFGGRLTTLEELPRLSRRGGQFLVPVPDGGALEALLDHLRRHHLLPENPRRLTLIGGDCTTGSQLQELGQAGIGVIGFPGRLEQSLQQCAARPGADLDTCCAWRTLSHLGAKVAFGGVDVQRPFAGLQKAVCRQRVCTTGRSEPSREAMTREEALNAMTVEAAWMDFQEDVRGRLKAGYQADLQVLDRDLFTCPDGQLGDARPVLVMAGGSVLWREI